MWKRALHNESEFHLVSFHGTIETFISTLNHLQAVWKIMMYSRKIDHALKRINICWVADRQIDKQINEWMSAPLLNYPQDSEFNIIVWHAKEKKLS